MDAIPILHKPQLIVSCWDDDEIKNVLYEFSCMGFSLNFRLLVLHIAIMAVKINVTDWCWVKDLCGMVIAQTAPQEPDYLRSRAHPTRQLDPCGQTCPHWRSRFGSPTRASPRLHCMSARTTLSPRLKTAAAQDRLACSGLLHAELGRNHQKRVACRYSFRKECDLV
jgi:hypothetical protein